MITQVGQAAGTTVDKVKGLMEIFCDRDKAASLGAGHFLRQSVKEALPVLTEIVRENKDPVTSLKAMSTLAWIGSVEETTRTEVAQVLIENLKRCSDRHARYFMEDVIVDTVGVNEAMHAFADAGEAKLAVNRLYKILMDEVISSTPLSEDTFKNAALVIEKIDKEKALPLLPVLIRALERNTRFDKNEAIHQHIKTTIKKIGDEKPSEVIDAFIEY